MKKLREVDPEIYCAVRRELKRQRDHIELIASENFTSAAVMEAQGSVMTNKYAEGYPSARWYGGCEHVDEAESLAIRRARELFGAEHVNVQPHSGSQANMAVMMAVLRPGDRILALDLACGGHLTHGHPRNFSGLLYDITFYGVDRQSEQFDYEGIRALARQSKPKLVIAGASAYPRAIDFRKFRDICDEAGAMLLVDMAHIAGLVAAGVHPSPVPYAEFITTTTHKTLRGPRGGMILCRREFAKKIDVLVFPGIQGGPLMHTIAAKAVALREALSPAFKEYQRQVVANARALAAALGQRGLRVVSGGTDTHLVLVDVSGRQITGREASDCLGRVNITVNKNLIPYDQKPPLVTSGVRLGTAAVTTRGMKEAQMDSIAGIIDDVLRRDHIDRPPRGWRGALKKRVAELTKEFPLYR